MGYFLFVLVTATLFVRPAEIFPAVYAWPIYEYLILACLAVSLPGVLKQFSIISPVTDTAGAATLQLFPAIIPFGPYQNCSASPTTGGSVSIVGASGTQAQTAFAFQEDAFTWVSIPLQDVSEYGAKCYTLSNEEGLSIRCIQQWDNRLGEVTTRMDFVWGIASTESDHKSLVIFG